MTEAAAPTQLLRPPPAGSDSVDLDSPTQALETQVPRSADKSKRVQNLPRGMRVAGRYRILKKVAEGGLGVVYKATDRRRGLPVAIKIPKPHPRIEQTTALDQEYKRLQWLKHDHIVRAIGLPSFNGIGCLVMEWLDGETVAAKIKRKEELGADQVRAIIVDLADALAYAHDRGVVHGDLKPANVQLTRKGAKLMDFGGLQFSENGERSVLATREYASPQVLQGAPPTPADDVYSLGVLAYRMLTHRLPFGSHDAAQAFELEAEAAVHDLDPELRDIVMKCLALDPEERFEDALDLLAAMAPPKSVAIMAERRHVVTTRQRSWAWGIAASLLAALGLAFGMQFAPEALNFFEEAAAKVVQEEKTSAAPQTTPSVVLEEATAKPIILAVAEVQAEEAQTPSVIETADELLAATETNTTPPPIVEKRPKPVVEQKQELVKEVPAVVEPVPVERKEIVLQETETDLAPKARPLSYWLAEKRDQRPVGLKSVTQEQDAAPLFPPKHGLYEGYVLVDFVIAPTGRPVGTRVRSSNLPAAYTQEALAAVTQWRFARRDTGTYVVAEVKFDPTAASANPERRI